MSVYDLLRDLVRKRRQSKKPRFDFKRPSLDLVDFGLQPGIVLDVGANLGGFASQVLVQAPLSQVHCFEPNGQLCEKLRSQAATWGTFHGSPRGIVNHKGVGSSEDRKELIVTKLHAASSFLPVGEATRAGWPNVDFSESRTEIVSVTRLDNYLEEMKINAVKLLKLDVQGFELEALKGCGKRLSDIQYILSEVQFAPLYSGAPLWYEVIKYTSDFGFQPVVMDGLCFGPEGQPLQADVLLKRV